MEKDFIIRPIVNCIPAWLRFAQCLRRYYDTKEAFPHLVNAGKYATTFFVVIFATMKTIYRGKLMFFHIVPSIFHFSLTADVMQPKFTLTLN